jgi:hypothetical protein
MTNFRLKLSLPQGAQFEAEGNEEFIQKEKDNFLELVNTKLEKVKIKSLNISAWQDIAYIKDNIVVLKTKYPDTTPSQAALLILAISQNVLQSASYSALKLSQSLKKSGYIKGRIDRIINTELKNSTIIAAGTKRNRTYQLTQKGISKAYLIAEKISRHIPAGITQYLTKYPTIAKN